MDYNNFLNILFYSTGPPCTQVEYFFASPKIVFLNFDYQITLFFSFAAMLLTKNFLTSAPFKINYFLQPRDDINKNTLFQGL